MEEKKPSFTFEMIKIHLLQIGFRCLPICFVEKIFLEFEKKYINDSFHIWQICQQTLMIYLQSQYKSE